MTAAIHPYVVAGDPTIEKQNSQREATNAHGGTTDAGANGVPTPGSFGGLENREEVIAEPALQLRHTCICGALVWPGEHRSCYYDNE